MRDKKLSLGIRVAWVMCAGILLMAGTLAAGQESVIYSFTGGTIGSSDGRNPYGDLIFDSSGNLYGTASSGGVGGGVVFELSPVAGGGWSQKILYSFIENGKDGTVPLAGLLFDSAGNLYGTTEMGGAYNYGTVFELRPSSGGTWKEGVLHSFNNNGKDGIYPRSGLTLDASGNLCGGTPMGGTHNGGTVFELTRKSNAAWAEKVLGNFPNPQNIYSSGPYNARLIFDSAGNLYGTTQAGGVHSYGSVFELSPAAGGAWTPKVLHRFDYNGTDGISPEAGVVFDSAGNLYGTTDSGGPGNGFGTVFELSPATGGRWTEKVLFTFAPWEAGTFPAGSPILDSAGNLYGTTYSGGGYNGGTVFELTPSAGGNWTWNLLYSFGNGTDGTAPWASLVFDSHGNLYGTTLDGGADGSGTVFEITP
jgi:uncharacterized repeat protein (TIGR03803 family)